MKINDDLNLVLELDDNRHLFHTPLSVAVYEANYKILAATQAELFGDGLKRAFLTGQGIAALTLVDEGKRIATSREEEGDHGASALLDEITRKTTILSPGADGWEFLPVEIAIQKGLLDAQEWKEMLSSIVFFTCACYLSPSRARRDAMKSLAETIGASTTVLNPEAYADSLKTPKAAGKKAASSVPV